MDDVDSNNTCPFTKQIINGMNNYGEVISSSSNAEQHQEFALPSTSIKAEQSDSYETWSKILPAISSTIEPAAPKLTTRFILPHITQSVPPEYSSHASTETFSEGQPNPTATANSLPSFYTLNNKLTENEAECCSGSSDLISALRRDVYPVSAADAVDSLPTCTNHLAPYVNVKSNDDDKEMSSPTESQASSLGNTPYKRYYDRSATSSPLEPLDLPHLLPKKLAPETSSAPALPVMATSSPSAHQFSSKRLKYHHMNIVRSDMIQPGQSPHHYMYPINNQAIYGGFIDPNYNQNIPYNHAYPPLFQPPLAQVTGPSPPLHFPPAGVPMQYQHQPEHLSSRHLQQKRKTGRVGTSTPSASSKSTTDILSKSADSTNDDGSQENPSPSSFTDDKEKPSTPYVELIAMAILSSEQKKMLIAEIYSWLMKKYPYFTEANERSWRNSVRHNLSLMKCFVKVDRAPNGRGYYWSIHDKFKEAFANGDFSVTGCKERKKQADMARQKKYFHLLTACGNVSNDKRVSTAASHSARKSQKEARNCNSVPKDNHYNHMITVSVPVRPHSSPVASMFGMPVGVPQHEHLLTFAQPMYPTLLTTVASGSAKTTISPSYTTNGVTYDRYTQQLARPGAASLPPLQPTLPGSTLISPAYTSNHYALSYYSSPTYIHPSAMDQSQPTDNPAAACSSTLDHVTNGMSQSAVNFLPSATAMYPHPANDCSTYYQSYEWQ